MSALDELEKKPYEDMSHLEKAIISYQEYDGMSSELMVKEANEAAAELEQLRADLADAWKITNGALGIIIRVASLKHEFVSGTHVMRKDTNEVELAAVAFLLEYPEEPK
mgnify:CR=1 FL=1